MQTGWRAGTLATVDDHSKIGARIEITWSLALGLRRSAAVSVAAAVPVLALGAGCQADEDGVRITNVAFDGDSTITLTFSEPLADFDEVDPNAFRLSWGHTVRYTQTYENAPPYVNSATSYYDLNTIFYYGYYLGPLTFTSLTAGPSANQIALRTAKSIGPEACDTLAQSIAEAQMYAVGYPGRDFEFAIFLHYAGGDIPIESETGSVLGDIGADWVRNDEWSVSFPGYGFADLSPQLRIPCP